MLARGSFLVCIPEFIEVAIQTILTVPSHTHECDCVRILNISHLYENHPCVFLTDGRRLRTAKTNPYVIMFSVIATGGEKLKVLRKGHALQLMDVT